MVPVSVRRPVGGELMLDMWDLAMKAALDESGQFSPARTLSGESLVNAGMVKVPDDNPENRAMVAIGMAIGTRKEVNGVIHRLLSLMDLLFQKRIPGEMLIQPATDEGEPVIHPCLIAAVGEITLSHGGGIPIEQAMKVANKHLEQLRVEQRREIQQSTRTLQ